MKKVLLFAAFLFVVCGASLALGQAQGELVVAQGAEVNGLDPARHSSVTDANYAIAVFDMLYFRDEKGVAQPQLALSHKIINETTWQFKLRPNVKFHNGAVMTANDVKFSIDRMINPQTKALFASFYDTIKEVKIIDKSTIEIMTKAPDPLLLKRLSWSMYILPAELFAQKGAEAFFQSPVGTGPFKFVSWARNEKMVLEANPAYWNGAPKVKRLIFRAIPETATRIAELQTGNADIITAIPPFLIDQLKASTNATVQSVPGGRAMYLYLNTMAKGPLQDKRVRQALNYAVNRKAIISNMLKGSGVEMVLLTPYHFGYDPSVKPYPYDPAKAKKLLADAGFGKGLKLVFNSPNGRYVLDKEVSEALAGMFREVGVETEMKVLEWGTYIQMLSTTRSLQDIGFIGWGNTMHDADGTLTPFFIPDSPQSYYSTPALADKISKARTTMDPKKRILLYKEIQKDISEEAPLVFLYQQIDNYGVSKKVKDFHARGDEMLSLAKVSK